MTEAVQRGFVAVPRDSLSERQLARLEAALVFEQQGYRGATTTVKAFKRSSKSIHVPRWYARREFSKTHTLVDLRSSGRAIKGIEFVGKLGDPKFKAPPEQEEAVATVVAAVQKNDLGGWLESYTGSGKTIMAMEIARRLGLSTLIVTHKTALRKQWVDTIKAFFRTKNGGHVEPGIVQEGRCEFGPKYPFSIALAQSLYSREYPPEFYEAFGLVIFDEGHHTPCDLFGHAVFKVNAKYVIAVTATKERRDGLAPMFDQYIGPTLYRLKEQKRVGVVHFLKVDWPGSLKLTYTDGMRIGKKYAKHKKRNEAIAHEIAKAVEHKRKVIVLTHTRNHLKAVGDKVKELYPELRRRVGYFVGGRTESQLKTAKQRDVILATYEMAGEGFDKQSLDLAIFASAPNNIVQAAGRVRAISEGAKKPMVVVIADYHRKLLRKWQTIRREFNKLGWRIGKKPPRMRAA